MTGDNSYEPESIWEMRRKAPFHFLAKADNARMSAYILSHVDDSNAKNLVLAAGYGGSHRVALCEAFLREASIAVELILKAILCVKTKKAPPATHDVYELWSKSGLPQQSDDDYHRLATMTETLYWSGRYAAPKSDTLKTKFDARFEKHQKTKPLGALRIIMPTSLGWDEFEVIYQKAAHHFWSLEPNDPKNFVA